jgi:peroxiredoxin Q/BCP
MKSKLKVNDKAPDFSGVNEKNETISLKDYKGRKLVLYFYPKDNTPGCTVESCNLRDNYHTFLAQGYEVLGVSADSVKKHQNFIKKYNLPFSLIADTEMKICNDYGVWGEKSMFGVNFMGIIRTTFVINEKGIIERIIDKVDTAEHAGQILGK